MYKEYLRERQHVDRVTNYPFLMVHGFGGWGDDCLLGKFVPYWGIKKSRDAVNAMRELGFDVLAPTTLPVGGNWDRACDLYAQLTGTRVDYGKVHSEKYGHERYGRTYDKPLVPNWGDENKINLIGHSLGGPTTRLLIELLAEGSEEERAGTPEDELSDLFKGGKAGWIHTCTELACSNGVSLATGFCENKYIYGTVVPALIWMIAVADDTPFRKVIDFKMDHYHVTPTKEGKHFSFAEKRKYAKIYQENKVDNVGWEMTVRYSRDATGITSPKPNIYYFSHCGDTTEAVPGTNQHRAIKGTNPFMGACANFEGKYLNEAELVTEDYLSGGDGMVNLASGLHPFQEPFKKYEGPESIEPGIWLEMPIEQKHHISYMGVGEPAASYNVFFYDIMKRACSLPPVDVK